jgi:hypothetical protein
MRAARWQALALLPLLSSCTSESDEPEPRSDAGDVDRPDDAGGAGASAGAVGRFQITMVRPVAASGDEPASPAYTSVVGRVYDAEVPPNITWTATADEGACRLLEPSIPACDPACRGTDVCVEDGRCVAHPRSLDLGTVTLRGLTSQSGDEAIAIDPLPPSNNYQLPGGVQLAHPPFAEGDPITLDAEGGDLPAVTIETTGIAELEPTIDGPLRFTPDSATELRWAPPAAAAASRIVVRVDISHHGGQKGEIVCDAADTGTLAIPAALGAQLIELGIAGYPSLQIAREAIGTADAAGIRIALAVTSPVTIDLEIPGLVSCDDPGTQDVCPDGQSCQPDWRCQ